jgi:hypothetical protein
MNRTTEESIQYWGEQQDELGFETVWSIWEARDISQSLCKNRPYRVYYRFYAKDTTVEQLMNDTAQEIEVSSLAVNGTVRELWRAAESCFQQAKAQGDWHKFIEDFQIDDNGEFELTMGS